MESTSPSPWPCYTEEEIEAVERVLRSNRVNYWTGSEGREFEAEFAAWVDTKYAVAVMNGTVALDLALRGLGIGKGDEVIVTPRTFIASVSCVVNAGAQPVFADVDRDSGNLTAETIHEVISDRTRAVVVVHLAGWPCDMDPIMELANTHGLKVIEDCAQAHGAKYKGRSVGSIGHVGAWSFCQDKIMTTAGEGGMVTTNCRDLWSRMWAFKDHGKSWHAICERKHGPGFRWVHESFGTNWRMTEVQAAIGRKQLERIGHWTAKRNTYARYFSEALMMHGGKDGLLRLPSFGCSNCRASADHLHGSCCVHAYYKFYAYLRTSLLARGWDRDRVIDEINSRGIRCFHGSCSEVYREAAFDETGWRPINALPKARELGETSLMWEVHPSLNEQEIEIACDTSSAVLAKARVT